MLLSPVAIKNVLWTYQSAAINMKSIRRWEVSKYKKWEINYFSINLVWNKTLFLNCSKSNSFYNYSWDHLVMFKVFHKKHIIPKFRFIVPVLLCKNDIIIVCVDTWWRKKCFSYYTGVVFQNYLFVKRLRGSVN